MIFVREESADPATHLEPGREAFRALAERAFGPPSELSVPRDDARNLAFSGWRIATGLQGTPGTDPAKWERGIIVRIYLTTGLHYVALAMRWMRGSLQGPITAAALNTPEELLAWLIQDGGGKLGRSSKAAWTEACRAWPPLADNQDERNDAALLEALCHALHVESVELGAAHG